MNDYHGRTPYYRHNEYRTKYARGYHGQSQRTIGYRPERGHYNQRNYRESNQVNRGRGVAIDRNDRRGDYSYDRRGNENKKGDRGNRNDRGDRGDRGNKGHGNDNGGGKGKKDR